MAKASGKPASRDTARTPPPEGWPQENAGGWGSRKRRRVGQQEAPEGGAAALTAGGVHQAQHGLRASLQHGARGAREKKEQAARASRLPACPSTHRGHARRHAPHQETLARRLRHEHLLRDLRPTARELSRAAATPCGGLACRAASTSGLGWAPGDRAAAPYRRHSMLRNKYSCPNYVNWSHSARHEQSQRESCAWCSSAVPNEMEAIARIRTMTHARRDMSHVRPWAVRRWWSVSALRRLRARQHPSPAAFSGRRVTTRLARTQRGVRYHRAPVKS